LRDSEHEVLFGGPPRAADERIAYGPEPLQFGDLRLPRGRGPHPLVIAVHGGAWKAIYNLIHAGHLCEALRELGVATWSVEYRAVGDPGGGWPGSQDDVALAVEFADELVHRHPLDTGRRLLVGHSAGGQLALWAAKRARLPVVGLAPVSDLRESATRTGRDGAPASFVGGPPNQVSERYAEASPLEQLPLGVRQILVHGTEDPEVPYAMSERYVAAAGGEAELVTLEGAGHFELIDPEAREWPAVEGSIRRLL
jgi:acetyl esterase/lipase